MCGRSVTCLSLQWRLQCKQVSLLHFQSGHERSPPSWVLGQVSPSAPSLEVSSSDSFGLPSLGMCESHWFSKQISWGLISQGQVPEVDVGHVGFQPFATQGF